MGSGLRMNSERYRPYVGRARSFGPELLLQLYLDAFMSASRSAAVWPISRGGFLTVGNSSGSDAAVFETADNSLRLRHGTKQTLGYAVHLDWLWIALIAALRASPTAPSQTFTPIRSSMCTIGSPMWFATTASTWCS